MTSAAQKIVTPGGETLVVVPLAEYQALIDAADVADARRIMADIASGREELIPAAVVDRFLAGENAIRVWREYRGLSASELAAKAGLSAAYVSELEIGKKTGTVDTLRKIADALGLTLDDLVP
jgi:ribosome-binding protein aMBF1 (putative translation factor)